MISLSHKPESVSRELVNALQAPEPTATWNPLSHSTVLEAVEERLSASGIVISEAKYVVSHEGHRLFATMKLVNAEAPDGTVPTAAVRSSTDQRYACSIAAGMVVVCCSNGSFSSDEIALSRKHTANIGRDLPELVNRAVHRLKDMWDFQRQQVEAYRNSRLSDVKAHDLIIKAMDAGAYAASQIPEVLSEWRRPSHAEFGARNVWSMFNAGTELLKKANPFTLAERTRALHGVCDAFVGLN